MLLRKNLGYRQIVLGAAEMFAESPVFGRKLVHVFVGRYGQHVGTKLLG